MLTGVPQQRWGAANFAGALGKGSEAIHLVPFLALTPDAGTEQEGDSYGEILKPLLKGISKNSFIVVVMLNTELRKLL